MRVGGRLLRILFLMTIVFTVWTYSISAAEEKQPEKNGDIVNPWDSLPVGSFL